MKKIIKNTCIFLVISALIIMLTGCSLDKEYETANRVIVEVDDIDRSDDVTEEIIKTGKQISDSVDESTKKAAENADNQAVEIFNSRFLMYEGIQNSTTIKSLITQIQATNQMSSEHQISIQGISNVSEISKDSQYNVSFKKDSDGYINKAIIKEK